MILGNWTDSPCFYVTATDAGRWVALLGPFREEAVCRSWAYCAASGGEQAKHNAVIQEAERLDPGSAFYSFGMVKCADGHKEGKFNERFSPGCWTGGDFKLKEDR